MADDDDNDPFHNDPFHDDDPFDLIAKGNAHTASGNHWSASHYYLRASSLLDTLSVETKGRAGEHRRSSVDGASCNNHGTNNTNDFRSRIKKAVELERISKLYHRESLVYFDKGRTSLMDALKVEHELDLRTVTAAGAAAAGGGAVSTSSAAVSTGSGGVQNSKGGRSDDDRGGKIGWIKDMVPEQEVLRRRKIFDDAFGRPSLSELGVVPNAAKEDRPSTAAAAVAMEHKEVQTEKEQEDPEQEQEKQDEASAPTVADLDIPAAPVASRSNDNDNNNNKNDDNDCSNENDDNDAAKNDDKVVDDLETRLASFESTLPSSLKTDAERVRDINRGLKGLGGYALPTSPDIKRHLNSIHASGQKPLSDEEQIRRIVEMAKDEARLEGIHVDDNAVDDAVVAAVGGGAEAAAAAVNDEDAMVINDEDDLAAILQKAHLGVGDSINKSSIADMFSSISRVKDDVADINTTTTSSLAGRGRMLNLISAAQEHLFEASAYLEDEDDVDDGNDRDDDSAVYDDDGIVLPDKMVKTPVVTEGMERGKASLVEARKCIDAMLKSWPKGDGK